MCLAYRVGLRRTSTRGKAFGSQGLLQKLLDSEEGERRNNASVEPQPLNWRQTYSAWGYCRRVNHACISDDAVLSPLRRRPLWAGGPPVSRVVGLALKKELLCRRNIQFS